MRSFTSLITLLLIVSCKTAEATADIEGLFNLNLDDSMDYQKVTTKIDEKHIQYAHVLIIDNLNKIFFLDEKSKIQKIDLIDNLIFN